MNRLAMFVGVWAAIVVPVCVLIAAAYYLRSPFDWMAGVGLFVAGAVAFAYFAESGNGS